MNKIIISELRVRFGECDFYQHVNNASYNNYFDIGITDFFKKVVYGEIYSKDTKKNVFVFHLVHANIDYKSSATFDDILVVSTFLEKAGNSSITFKQEIRLKETEEILVTAKRVGVFLDSVTLKKITVPEEIRNYVHNPEAV